MFHSDVKLPDQMCLFWERHMFFLMVDTCYISICQSHFTGTVWGATIILGIFIQLQQLQQIVRTGDFPICHNIPYIYIISHFFLSSGFFKYRNQGKLPVSQARHVIEVAGVDTWFLKLPGGEWEEAVAIRFLFCYTGSSWIHLS